MTVAQRAGNYLLMITLVLVGLGVVMIYSSSSIMALIKFKDSAFFLERQLIRAVIGLGMMACIAFVPARFWARISPVLLGLGLASLVLVLIQGSGPGAQRWLRLPVLSTVGAFQPAEFVKLAIVLYLADVLVRKKEQMQDFRSGLMPRLAVIGVVLGLIVLQPDLGTAIAIGLVALAMLWLGGARPKHLFLTALASIPVVAYSLYRSPYQLRRLLSFLEMTDPSGADYQVTQSILALGSGGPIGIGLGNSMQKHFLPEPHTDFIFSFIGEELGLAGTLSVIALFIAFGIHGIRVACEAPTYHSFLVASGITAMISVYALINIGVATGLLPTTGLPLPFISYGGSALVWNLAGVGILISIARECGPGNRPWLPVAGTRSDRSAL